jgi:hypothetical protein
MQQLQSAIDRKDLIFKLQEVVSQLGLPSQKAEQLEKDLLSILCG